MRRICVLNICSNKNKNPSKWLCLLSWDQRIKRKTNGCDDDDVDVTICSCVCVDNNIKKDESITWFIWWCVCMEKEQIFFNITKLPILILNKAVLLFVRWVEKESYCEIWWWLVLFIITTNNNTTTKNHDKNKQSIYIYINFHDDMVMSWGKSKSHSYFFIF